MATPTKQALPGSGDGWVIRPTAAKEHPQRRLLNEPSATRNIYSRRCKAQEDEESGLEALEAANYTEPAPKTQEEHSLEI
ncbi:uncharacterized protein EURHEDRAFT_381135 [Aspergillus ruber CBS 135680]|uniref:Uncharacterized protein n=1 Tax=Aspergillus ruber (strain CBS 135680) TaxID=1388766 RepID=A0A017S2T8_ASPRC|nr:uncharacterized protein EURHEDRAFT_381135 [Aspergillus ruber CBS 135680]EYE91267.1 hypothetical protein EURHEDRAFT_381135 [Aspergillus ruber CBS 135680]